MLFEQRLLPGIADGSITVSLRRWKRPAARSGSRHRIPNGVIEIDAVDEVQESQVTPADVRASGYASRRELLDELAGREGALYRIRFHYGGGDERVVLRDDDQLSETDVAEIRRKLARHDGRSRHGSWTMDLLRLIAEHPGVRAADLAYIESRDTLPLKADVRKLKELGLTESLEVGYRLSPRGRAFLDFVRP